jgi:hypothetical protein
LNGVVANLAIYPYALTASQVANHYNATFQLPGILQPYPLVEYAQVGGTQTMSIAAYGPQPITYQWYAVTSGATNMIPGATNASYTLTDAALSNTGGYFCAASNPYGTSNSDAVMFNVLAPTSLYVSAVLADNPIAFLRLDEHPDNGAGNDQTIAYDTIGGHNGFYTNVVLASSIPNYSAYDPDNYITQFGLVYDTSITPTHTSPSYQDNYVGGINGISFATPTNTDTNFSVEAWVYLSGAPVSGAGIVAMGTGGGGEEFALDTGGTSSSFRLYFRTAGGNSLNATPNVAPPAGVWTHLAGVVNESNNVIYEYLYTNGVQANETTTTYSNAAGVQAGNLPVSIGARTSAAATNYNLQLNGGVADVAIYPYALSASQVLNHYLASGIARPLRWLPPT